MDIKDDIVGYKEQYDVDFDDNLYVALMLAGITKRHLLLSSSNLRATETELMVIIRRLWKLQLKVIWVDEGPKKGVDDLLYFFTSAALDQNINAIYVIVGLDKLSNQLQSVVLEVMRTRKVTYKNKVYYGSELFMVIGVLDDYNSKDKQLFSYLQDEFWFKQPHDPTQGKINETNKQNPDIDTYMVRKFKAIGDSVNSVVIVPEIKRYIYDIVIFIRTHRCVDTGLPGRILGELELLSKALCVLFNKGFVIPSIIKLASRKLLPLKIKMIKPDHEPSLQWGSDPELVNALMKRMTPNLVVEDVLNRVSPPV